MRQQVELPVLFSDSMRPDELELLQCKLVKLILHLPDGRLLQLDDGLLGWWFLLTGLPQVGLLPCDNRRGGLTLSWHMNSVIQHFYTDMICYI